MPCSGHALTQLPAAHVIELCAEEQGGNDVDDGEDDPERRVAFAKDLSGNPHGQGDEGLRTAAPMPSHAFLAGSGCLARVEHSEEPRKPP
jgi:hypothetical protein